MISYEEVKDQLKYLERYFKPMIYGNDNLANALSDVNDFIEQHKPPTWEEVVNAWEDLDYAVLVNSDNETQITSVEQNGRGELKHISFHFKEWDVSFGKFVYDLSKEELHAINLAIRYLESENK